MDDFILDRTPEDNPSKGTSPVAIQKVVRGLLRIARNTKLDRRGTGSERRRDDPDLVVELSQGSKREKRMRLERRNSYGYSHVAATRALKDQRKRRQDRRKLVNDGICLTLSSLGDRRSPRDRRRL